MPGAPLSDAPFLRVPISPVALYQEAWDRVKGQYWLFLAICAVGMLLGGLAPLCILLGPMMCGIYLCYRRQAQGEPIAFDLLFKGFEHFTESFIASLLMLAASLVVMVPVMVVLFAAVFAGVLAGQSDHAGLGAVGCVFIGAGVLLAILAGAVIGCFFLFAFPLVMDRRMKGVDAVKLSFQAARANLGGLLLLALGNALLGLLGVLCCYVGAFLVMPVTIGAQWICYERIFGIQASEAQAPQG